MIGKTISHYKILEKLGEGGMGVVYKAEDTKLRRTVALKFLSPQALGTEDEKTRFIHEAQAAAILDHPSICTVYEINEVEGRSFITMACVDGPSLREEIESGSLEVGRALDIAIQAAEGLREAHEKGIVHRDIKSANIMLTSRGQVKITDFGLAKLAGRTKLTKTGTTVGTVAYMSPEQARGEDVDRRTDIWSLGVVLYEMLTGKLPFEGDHEQAVAYSVLNKDPEPVRQKNPEVSAEFEAVVQRMLEKRPDDRYSDVGELLSDLRKIEAGEQVAVPLPSRRRQRVRRLVWGAVALVVVVGAVLGLSVLKGWLPLGPPPPKLLAVVDFDNIGGEDTGHLAEGLAEGISVKLSKLPGIRVVSSDDIRRLRREELSARDVASRLGAEFAVGGSLLRTGDQIRVTPRLIEASTGDVIWAELFDREFSDVFEFLDDVSLKIVSALEIRLKPADRVALKERSTDSPEAYDHYLKGRHFYYRVTFRDNDLAEKEFQKALQLDQDYALALAGLADTYVQRYKERFDYDEHWLDEADRLIDRALKLEPDLAEAYESRAEVLFEKENYLGALEAAEKAKGLRPDWDEPYLRLGETYQKRGEGSLALEMFDEALSIRPSVEGWCGKGNVLQTRGLVDSAEVTYREAARHSPHHDRPLYDLGNLYYYGLDDLEEGERMFRRAIEVRPDRGRSYEELAYLLFYDRERLQEAEELVRGFADRYPYHRDAYETLYELLAWNKGDYPAALEVIQEAAARNPDRVWPHLLLAGAYAEGLGVDCEPEKAVAAVQKALELRPESGRVLEKAGYVYVGLGDPKKALHYYRLALEARPGSPSVLVNMGELLIGQARFDSAAVVAAEAGRQSPGVVQGWGWDNCLEIALIHLMRADEYLGIIQDAADRYGRDEPFFYVRLGREQCFSGQYQEAIRSYNRVLDMRREGSPIGLYLTYSGLKGLGMAQWLSGDTKGALASFREATDREDTSESLLVEEISLLKYLGRFDEIEARLKSIREREFLDSWVWFVARYYPSMRRFDEVLSAVAEAAESGEVSWKADLALRTATWHRQKGDFRKAESVLRELQSSLPGAYQNLIRLEWAALEATRGDLTRSLHFAEKAYDEGTGFKFRNRYITLLSKLYYAQGRTQDALSVLAEANGFRAKTEAFYQRAQMAAVTQSPDADEELNRVLILGTRGSRGGSAWYLGLARIYSALASARLGDSERARHEIDYAVKLEPERADIAYGAACAYSLTGDTEAALDWLQTAVDRGHQELWWARVDPDLDNLRELPRFQKIMNDWDRRMRALSE